MNDEDDWRLQGQEKYLTGVALVRREWRQSRPNWDHDHCEFCWAMFGSADLAAALMGREDVQRDGWTTLDEYRWVCDDICFNDVRERFDWQISEDAN